MLKKYDDGKKRWKDNEIMFFYRNAKSRTLIVENIQDSDYMLDGVKPYNIIAKNTLSADDKAWLKSCMQ